MCAIVGFAGSDFDGLFRVLDESRIRGLHAFGYAFHDGSNVLSEKFLCLDTMKESLIKNRPKKLIAHCRYSTSGDWQDPRNNQPVVRGGSALVFNGVIDMGSKTEMEARHKMELESENDGEIFLQAAIEGRAQDFLASLSGSFAGLWFEGAQIMMARNTRRPAWIARTVDSVFLASTADIFSRAGIQAKTKPIPLEVQRFDAPS